jgi:hypothetical protein
MDLEQDNPSEQKTILYKKEDDIDICAKPAMIKIIASMLTEIKGIKEEFGLEADVDYTSKNTAASISEMWVLLEELKARRLKAYGDVSDAEKNLIEPHVMKLLEELEEIERLLKKHQISRSKE